MHFYMIYKIKFLKKKRVTYKAIINNKGDSKKYTQIGYYFYIKKCSVVNLTFFKENLKFCKVRIYSKTKNIR